MPGQINKETQNNPSSPLQRDTDKDQAQQTANQPKTTKPDESVRGAEDQSIRKKQDEEGQEEGGPR